MKIELLELLRCPKTGQRLNLESGNNNALAIEAGWAGAFALLFDGDSLVSEDGQHRYPIRKEIPQVQAGVTFKTGRIWSLSVIEQ